jgi:transcriptional regulator with XRE-family HTH domain
MPYIDPGARNWELDLAGRFGAAILARRKALKMTAVQLAAKTKELGYPISRVAISKIENNQRAGKVDVAEVLVLAVALEIPPALLLFPGYPDDDVNLTPRISGTGSEAVQWISGESKLPGVIASVEKSDDGQTWETFQSYPTNPGVELVSAVKRRQRLDDTAEMIYQQAMVTREAGPGSQEERDRIAAMLLSDHRRDMAQAARELETARAKLWADHLEAPKAQLEDDDDV